MMGGRKAEEPLFTPHAIPRTCHGPFMSYEMTINELASYMSLYHYAKPLNDSDPRRANAPKLTMVSINS
jgi:hypothetical protein